MTLRVPENISQTVMDVAKMLGHTPQVHSENIDDISIHLSDKHDIVAFMPSSYQRIERGNLYGAPLDHMKRLENSQSCLCPQIMGYCRIGGGRYGVIMEHLDQFDEMSLDFDLPKVDRFLRDSIGFMKNMIYNGSTDLEESASLAIDEAAGGLTNGKDIDVLLEHPVMQVSFLRSWYGLNQWMEEVGVSSGGFNHNMFGMDSKGDIKIRSTAGFRSVVQQKDYSNLPTMQQEYHRIIGPDRNYEMA